MSKHKRPLSLREEDFFRIPSHPRKRGKGGIWHSLGRLVGGVRSFRSDSLIREEVSEQLANHPAIDSGAIEVQVKRGVVHLSGQVHDRWTKRAAEWAVERVPGVKDVQNHLQVESWQERQHRSA